MRARLFTAAMTLALFPATAVSIRAQTSLSAGPLTVSKGFHGRDLRVWGIGARVRNDHGALTLNGEMAEGLSRDLPFGSQWLSKAAVAQVEVPVILDQRDERCWHAQRSCTQSRDAVETRRQRRVE
jgi:hypothetical protein